MSYETITVDGEQVYDLSDGETFENKLIDQTASGAVFTIRSRNASDWTVRNIGFAGSGQAADGDNRFQFQVSTPSGASGLIENIWASGMARDGQPASQLGGIYLRSSHAGHIDVRHTFIEGFGNNAIYASGPGKDSGNDGSVTIENSYHRNNTVSQFRIGTPDSVVRHSIGIVNDPNGKRGKYPGGDTYSARGIWGKHYPDQRVENCAFYISPDDVQPNAVFHARYIQDRSHGSEAILEAVDCDYNADAPTVTASTNGASVNLTRVSQNPTTNVLQNGGVPTSPEMAAAGNRTIPDIPEIGAATPTTEVSLTVVEDDTGNIRVKVSNENGEPVPKVPVNISNSEMKMVEYTNSDGEILFKGMTIGDYTIECAPSGYKKDSKSITAKDFA